MNCDLDSPRPPLDDDSVSARLVSLQASLGLAHRRMRELAAELRLAEERERRRLADRLHDNTIQQLVLARMLVGAGAAAAGASQSKPDRLGQVRVLLDTSLAQLRSLVFELSPPVLYQGGLVPALQWLAGDLSERWPVRFACRLEGEMPPVPDDLKVTLFQAARELMINVCKHARANQAQVLVQVAPPAARLVVSDDGIGIDPALMRGPCPGVTGGGFGLFSLRSRIELIGGQFSLGVRPGGGTEASLWVPLAEASAATARQ